MNNKFAAKVAKTMLYFAIRQCKKGVLFSANSYKAGTLY